MSTKQFKYIFAFNMFFQIIPQFTVYDGNWCGERPGHIKNLYLLVTIFNVVEFFHGVI
jgi:hypothetical protein